MVCVAAPVAVHSTQTVSVHPGTIPFYPVITNGIVAELIDS